MAKAKKITIVNHKGGVGKTTTANNLAAGITRITKVGGGKYRVLLIDMDPQSNATSTLYPFVKGGGNYKKALTVVDVFSGEPLDNCIVNTSTKGLDLCPSHIDLFEIELKLAASVKAVEGLKSAIRNSTVDDVYDVIIIDSPPNLGPFMINSLVASDYYIIPLDSESVYSLEGVKALTSRISELKEIANNKLKLLGYLITKHDGRNSTCKSMVKTIRSLFEEDMLDTFIRTNTDINKAAIEKRTIFQQSLLTNGAKDYSDLSIEVISKLHA